MYTSTTLLAVNGNGDICNWSMEHNVVPFYLSFSDLLLIYLLIIQPNFNKILGLDINLYYHIIVFLLILIKKELYGCCVGPCEFQKLKITFKNIGKTLKFVD